MASAVGQVSVGGELVGRRKIDLIEVIDCIPMIDVYYFKTERVAWKVKRERRRRRGEKERERERERERSEEQGDCACVTVTVESSGDSDRWWRLVTVETKDEGR